jgi:hypothetical protein
MTAPEPGSSDEVARLLALLIRLEIGNQAQAIVELSRLGIGPSRVADLLGTTSATARVTVHQHRQKGGAGGSRKGKPDE